MPIQVTCPGCHTRFRVSEKFAGQSGPCPKCKGPIRIPSKSEEVVIHAPEEFGPKDVSGRAVLKPIERTESSVTPVGIVAIIGSVVLVLAVAFLLGRAFPPDQGVPTAILAMGAVVLAPPLVFAGYAFLREDEREPYRGTTLAIRVAICSVVYPILWGVYSWVAFMLFGDSRPEIWQLVFVLPVFVAAGLLAPLAALDLDATSSAVHYGLYLLCTVLLRVVMGMPPL